MGVKIGNTNVSIILYADDIILISNTVSGLQKQLDTISNYGKENGLKYNADKTFFMDFNGKLSKNAKVRLVDKLDPLILDGKMIKRVESMRCLGLSYRMI